MARDFDGVDDLIALGDIAEGGLTTFGLACWVNADTLGDYRMIFSHFDGGNRIEIGLGGALEGDNNEVVIHMTAGASAFGVTSANIVTTGAWHHWFVYYDGGGGTNADKLKLYFNGAAQTLTFTGTIPTTTPNATNSATIGNRNSAANAHDGKLAEFAIWTGLPGGMAAADAALILADGYSPAHLRRNGLHYYPLIGRHSPEIDLWGGNSGTVTGAIAGTHPRIIMPRRRRGAARAATPLPYTLFAQACL